MIHMIKINDSVAGTHDWLIGCRSWLFYEWTSIAMESHTTNLRHRLTVQHIQEGLVGGLLLVVVVPQQRITLSRERSRDPRVLVCNTPEGDTDAARDVDTALRYACVSCSMRGQLLLVAGCVHADVKLGVCDIDAEAGVVVKHTSQGRYAGSDRASGACRLGQKVSLQTNTIDLHAPGLDELDNAHSTLVLGRAVLEVVWGLLEQLLSGVESGTYSHCSRASR
jgi:hypothetical protein